MTRWLRTLFWLNLAVLWATPALPQSQRDGRLLITVIDQTNAVIPGAIVNVTGLEAATQKVPLPPAQTLPTGLASIAGVPPGRYTVRAEFPGFAPGILKEIRVRAGDNRHVVVLPIERLQEAVDVKQDAQAGAADRRGDAFGSVLTREQMDALSDDPDEMQRQLQDMAGPGAILRIDSFEGGRLPPKAQIKSIRVTRDQFAAENHSADGVFIEIITQPGIGPVRTYLNYNMRNSAMSARNAFTPTKGNDQDQNYGIFINGGVIANVASFSLGVRGNSSFDTPNLSVARPTGTRIETLKQRMPRENVFISGTFDYAMTRDQTLRLSYNQGDTTNRNLGIGGFNEPERAYTNENHTHTFRIQEVGPIGRRFFINSRFNVGWTDTASRSVLEAPTIKVLDQFTSGGAQVGGGRHSRDVTLASDLDYVRGIHSVRIGTAIDANWYRSDDTSNYLGTYTFETLEAFLGGRPRSFTQRIGDPNLKYFNMQAAFYAQDDIRVRRSFTVTPGVRYEAQTHVNGRQNLGPRFGLTWAPFRNGKTTLRTSWGVFYDWLQTNTYEQTLRVDGFRQRELDIVNPSFPDPAGSITSVPPINRYLLDPDLQHARSSRVSAGVDYAFSPRIRANATYRHIRGTGMLRGRNLNNPVGGVRPHPEFGNIVEVVADASGRQHVLSLGGNSAPPPIPGSGGPLWDWKRFAFFGTYTFTRNENDTDGAFSTPATGSLAAEWGTAPGTASHRLNGGFFTGLLRDAFLQVNVNGSTGTPYTIQTGRDDDGDLVFNDRPVGVGRNTGRTSGQLALNVFAGYTFTFGPSIQLPPAIVFGPGGGGGVNVTTVAQPQQGRYRMSINFNIQNLTNRANLIGYSGVLTSPFFGKPTMAMNPRRISIGFGLGF
jgi:hypothetical protein